MRKSVSELSIQGDRFYPIVEMDTGKGPLWLPSVTSALSVWPKPALVNWSASSEKLGILDEMEAWLHDDEGASRGAMLARVLKMREMPLRYREVSRSAKDIGSSAHAWLEWKIRKDLGVKIGPEPALLPESERAVSGALVWMDDVKLRPIDVERKVYDAVHGYAGRYDLKAEVDWVECDEPGLSDYFNSIVKDVKSGHPRVTATEKDIVHAKVDRRIVIVDWKSSKGIYPDMAIQNVAYRQADAAMKNEPRSKGGIIVRLAKTEDDPLPFEAVQVPYSPQAFETFKAALAFWRLWRQQEGKWIGGHATDDEVALIGQRSKGRKGAPVMNPDVKMTPEALEEKYKAAGMR